MSEEIKIEPFYDEKQIINDNVVKKSFHTFRHNYVDLMERLVLDKIPFTIFINAIIIAYINEDETLRPFLDKIKKQFSKLNKVSQQRLEKIDRRTKGYRDLYGVGELEIEDIVDNGDFYV